MLFMLMSKSRTNSKAENRESPRSFTGRASRGPFLQQFLHLPTVYQDLPGSARIYQDLPGLFSPLDLARELLRLSRVERKVRSKDPFLRGALDRKCQYL